VVCRREGCEAVDEAVTLANATPCDPKTLTRAARDFAQTHPVASIIEKEVGL
jgi:hypothetical protein